MMRRLFLAVAIFAGSAAFGAQPILDHGQFTLKLQSDNALLPASLVWKPKRVELLAPRTGLNLAFVSFERRTKIYHDENRHVWGDRSEPRFVTDARNASVKPVQRKSWAGLRVEYDSSYARIARTILVHDKDPHVRIEYDLTMTRDVVLHETHNLGVSVSLGPGFHTVSVCDARSAKPALLTQGKIRQAAYATSLLHPGAKLFTHSAKGVSVVVDGDHGASVLANPPARLVTLPKGRRVVFVTHMGLGLKENHAMTSRLFEAHRALTQARKPFALVQTARVLAGLGKVKEAEEALLLAAKLAPDYAVPYSRLAALRRDKKLSRHGQTLAWVEAGYRNPYNYGYMLSGSGLHRLKGLTEAQRRMHIFNVLIAVENTVFYADYYIWAARGFLEMKMYAQACAMYRQALWAIDHTPRPEKHKEKYRKRFRKKIAELESKMLGKTNTQLPPLIPVRPSAPR